MKEFNLLEICNPKQWKTIPVKNLKNDGKYKVYGANGVIGTYNEYNHEDSTLLISCRGTCGNIIVSEPKSYINGNAMCLDNLNSKYFNIKYLYYYLKNYNFKDIISGSTVPQITIKGLSKIKIKSCDLKTQNEIITILEKIDKLICVKKLVIKKYDSLLTSQFVEMFGNIDDNIYNWPIKTFGELTDVITDGEHSTPKRDNEGIYLLSARNILNHSIELKSVDYISQDEYNRISKRIIPKKGDVLLSCSGSVGRCCSVSSNLKFQMVRSVALLRFKNTINPKFAEYMITSKDLQKQINIFKTASSQSNLFQVSIAKLKGFQPPIELQNKFVNIVEQIEKQKKKFENSLKKLEEMQAALMHEYFG